MQVKTIKNVVVTVRNAKTPTKWARSVVATALNVKGSNMTVQERKDIEALHKMIREEIMPVLVSLDNRLEDIEKKLYVFRSVARFLKWVIGISAAVVAAIIGTSNFKK